MMANRSSRGMGHSASGHARQSASFRWEPILRTSSGPAVMCAAQKAGDTTAPDQIRQAARFFLPRGGRPDTTGQLGITLEGLRLSSSTGLCLTIIDGSN